MTTRIMPLPYQINRSYNAIVRLGCKRHYAKQRRVDHQFIYSSSTYNRYRSAATCAIVAMAQRRPAITELRDVTHADIAYHIACCEAYGHARSTIAVLLAALRKLEHGMRANRWWSTPMPFVPHLMPSAPHSVRREPLAPADARRLIAQLDDEARLATLFAFNYGLRIHEVLRLRRRDIAADNALRVVGKGGRMRFITRMHDAHFLGDLPAGPQEALIFGPMTPAQQRSWVRRIERTVAQALDDLSIPHRDGDNVHALRRTYAAMFINDALERKIDEDIARRALSPLLGHNRTSVTELYYPRQTPRQKPRR